MKKISIRFAMVILPLAGFILCAIISGILYFLKNPQYKDLAILSVSFLIAEIISLKFLISDFKKDKLANKIN